MRISNAIEKKMRILQGKYLLPFQNWLLFFFFFFKKKETEIY